MPPLPNGNRRDCSRRKKALQASSSLAAQFEFVGIVEDGRALVKEAEKLPPDVIVADIGMPL